MVMLSQLLRFKLVGASRNYGHVRDLAIDVSAGDYPHVTHIVVHDSHRAPAVVDWNSVQHIDWRHACIVINADPSDQRNLDRAVLARRDALDALAIDVSHRQVVRINDVWLRHEDEQLWVRGADLSPWAVLRRLGRGLLGRGADRRLRDWKDIELLRGDPDAARAGGDYHRRIEQLQPSEIARLLDALPYLDAAEMLTMINDATAADTLEAMSPQRQKQVYLELDDDQSARLLALMAPDEAADLIGRLDLPRAENALRTLAEGRRELVAELLRYPEDTAGGIMTNDLVVVPAACSVAEAREILRQAAREPDFVYYLYVVDEMSERHLLGELTLRRLLLAVDQDRLDAIMRPVADTIDALLPAETAARKVVDRQLAALPVVTHEGRLVGAITADAAFATIAPSVVHREGLRVFS